MKTPEQLAKDLFGFKFIDEVEPEYRMISGNQSLLDKIQEIQKDASGLDLLEALRDITDALNSYPFDGGVKFTALCNAFNDAKAAIEKSKDLSGL